MKILSAEGVNFQSYPEIKFDYADLGLSLVSGATGGGKSSLLDLPAWGLYGITSKDLSADDVRSWEATGATVATTRVQVGADLLEVTRTRGKPAQNDLYWTENGGEPKRGKDMIETQKFLEDRLGVSSELFLIGSYMHQFSRADSFFIAKAKERREVMEKIADQAFPIKLAARTSEARKAAKRDHERLEADHERQSGRLAALKDGRERTEASLVNWNTMRVIKLDGLEEKFSNFAADTKAEVNRLVTRLEELDQIAKPASEYEAREAQLKTQLGAMKTVSFRHREATSELSDLDAEVRSYRRQLAELKALKDNCPTCKAPFDKSLHHMLGAQLDGKILDIEATAGAKREHVARLAETLTAEEKLRKAWDKLQADKSNNAVMIAKFEETQCKVLALRKARNPYADSIAAARAEVNPFIAELKAADLGIDKAETSLVSIADQRDAAATQVSALTWLYDKSFELRGLIMEGAVQSIASRTNEILERFFDAALRIDLSLKDADKLEVEIHSDGNVASFRQLSGGERCMLKLAFSLSLMRAAEEQAGVKFGMIMLDEALNGLDDGLKVKAFGLLQQLEEDYETVLLIDHCEELKGLFTSRFKVDKLNGHSRVEADLV